MQSHCHVNAKPIIPNSHRPEAGLLQMPGQCIGLVDQNRLDPIQHRLLLAHVKIWVFGGVFSVFKAQGQAHLLGVYHAAWLQTHITNASRPLKPQLCVAGKRYRHRQPVPGVLGGPFEGHVVIALAGQGDRDLAAHRFDVVHIQYQWLYSQAVFAPHKVFKRTVIKKNI